MKLRIRPVDSKETIRIETPEPCTLGLLKTLIGVRLGASPDSLRLSLNRRDELFATSPEDSLQSVGLASGDLVFYSTCSFLAGSGGGAREEEAATTHIPSNSVTDRGQSLSAASGGVVSFSSPHKPITASGESSVEKLDHMAFSSPHKPITAAGEASGEKIDHMALDPSSLAAVIGPEPGGTLQNQGAMDIISDGDEDGTFSTQKLRSFWIPGFLKRVLTVEHSASLGNLGLLATAVHAIFLEAGFVLQGTGGPSLLPEGWACQAPTLSISYTVPGLVGAASSSDGAAVDFVRLKLGLLGKFVKVYGSIHGSPYNYCVCLNVPKFAPAVRSTVGKISLKDEEEIFQLWKTVKDGLALRLLIDICEGNGLAPPPCFTRLPTDLKLMVLELLPGADLARLACVSSELKFLSSNDDLWRRKFEEEFGSADGKTVSWRRWKARFASSWERRKSLKEIPQQTRETYVPWLPFRRPRPLPVPYPAPRFPIIGGDHDLFPSIGGLRPGSTRPVPRPVGRRIFSPNCNLGGLDM